MTASTGPRSIERGVSGLILAAKDGLGKSKMRALWPQVSSQATNVGECCQQAVAGQGVVPRERLAVFPRHHPARVS